QPELIHFSRLRPLGITPAEGATHRPNHAPRPWYRRPSTSSRLGLQDLRRRIAGLVLKCGEFMEISSVLVMPCVHQSRKARGFRPGFRFSEAREGILICPPRSHPTYLIASRPLGKTR